MSDNDRFIVTGAAGCIGSWVVRNLIRENIPVAVFDLNQRLNRLSIILTEDEMNKIQVIVGDISKFEDVDRAIGDFGANHIIHLAAMQLPFCKADPVKGAMVNVVGTVNIFEAAKRRGIESISYASSTAVYGTSEDYPEGSLANDARLSPRSHYGVYKQANEGTAFIYSMEDGVSSIGLRPYVVYGAGRDQGMTATPTKAILAAVLGKDYHISYGGRYCFQYTDDVAKAFILASQASQKGAEVYNIGGASVSTAEVISVIEKLIPDALGKITFDDFPLPFPQEVDNSELIKVLGSLPETLLEDGVAETIKLFERGVKNGLIGKKEIEAQLK
jgi:nucleoside-diphosphate-sugar epimerase